jgi:hypothetical protein
VTLPEGHNLGRNDPCHCGSGRKYKQCCLDKDEAEARAARATAAAEAPPPAATDKPRREPKHQTEQPWKKAAMNTRGFHRATGAPRKVGGS